MPCDDQLVKLDPSVHRLWVILNRRSSTPNSPKVDTSVEWLEQATHFREDQVSFPWELANHFPYMQWMSWLMHPWHVWPYIDCKSMMVVRKTSIQTTTKLSSVSNDILCYCFVLYNLDLGEMWVNIGNTSSFTFNIYVISWVPLFK